MDLMSDMDDLDGVAGQTRSAHTASLFSSDEEQMSSAVPFLLAGIDAGEKCVYIVDNNSEDAIVDAVMKVRDVQSSLDSGQLTFFDKDETYLRDGRFDVGRMLSSLHEFERNSLSEGYKGLAITGEMTWSCADVPGAESLVEYEARVNSLYPESTARILCQYYEPSFDHEILLDVIRTHPKLIIDGDICTNPYFLPLEEFLSVKGGRVPEETYRRTTRDILKRVRLSMIHRLELRDFRLMRRKLSVIESAGLDEVGNLAAIIDFYNELALECSKDEIVREYILEVAKKCECLQRRIRFAKIYRHVGETEMGWNDLAAHLEKASHFQERGVLLSQMRIPAVQVLADDMFPYAVGSILDNIPDMDSGSKEVSMSCLGTEGCLVLSLDHMGVGVPESVKPLLFDYGRVFGQSDGFGLFLAREILTRSGMSVRECGVPGKGTRFEICIPATRHRLTEIS